jgi:CDP-paratose 2-epimerase
MKDPILICGGAGFIGTNLAVRLMSAGQRVIVYDDLSRAGVERNLQRMRAQFGSLIDFEFGDIRDAKALRRCVRSAASVFHFAAQTAVTTSLISPAEDFDINARGTLTLLEEMRLRPTPVPLVFTSTNKVYGNLERLALRLQGSRYEPQHPTIAAYGVDESWPLDFHSPYGCSKGAADQYVLDYARTYGLPNVTFRMSCIYGPHQCGTEDQGWVAHFAIQALNGAPITIYGDGHQVRDALYVEDLAGALVLAQTNADKLAGRAFNIGGGPSRTTSLLELVDLIGILEGKPPRIRFEDWRVGDQRYYVSDTRAFQKATGWRPRISVPDGVRRLHSWLRGTKTASTQMVEMGAA